MNLRCIICWIFCSGPLFGQGPELDQIAFNPGPFLTVDQSSWSIFRNMAGIAQLKSTELVFGYYLPYNLPDLQAIMLGVVFPSKPSLGLSVYQNGGELLRNQQLALISAIEFGKVLAGIRLKYWNTTISGLRSFTTATLDLGLQIELADHLLAGFYFSNVSGDKVGMDQPLPMMFASGIRFQPSDKLMVLFEIAHRRGEMLEFRQGLDYELKNRFNIRTGFNTYGKQGYFGLALQAFRIKFDYALTLHPYLGVTHQAGVSYGLP